MSAIDRFRKRQNHAMVLDVPWPRKAPLILFKVNRFAETEHNAAQRDALNEMAKRPRVENDVERQSIYMSEYCEALPKYVKRHVKTWVHTPPDGAEPVQFSVGALEAVVSEMSREELVEFGASYLIAAHEEGKKKENEVSSEKDSSSV